MTPSQTTTSTPTPTPSWQSRPTCEGWWVGWIDGQMQPPSYCGESPKWINCEMYFGPIPEPPKPPKPIEVWCVEYANPDAGPPYLSPPYLNLNDAVRALSIHNARIVHLVEADK